MANRPEKKKSAFGAAHPIEHEESQASPETPAQATVRVAAPPAAAPEPAGRGKQTKAAFMAPEDVINRIRAAWFHTPTTSGEREISFNEFLLLAALDRTEDREETYNNGQEFPEVPAGHIARGRR